MSENDRKEDELQGFPPMLGGSWDSLAEGEDTDFAPNSILEQDNWRIVGRRWLGFLYKVFRTFESSEVNDNLLGDFYQEWLPLSAEILRLETPSVLCGYGGLFFLNRKRLLFRTDDWMRVAFVQRRLTRCGWGGMRVQAKASFDEFSEFLRGLAADNPRPQKLSPPGKGQAQAYGTLSWITREETRQRWELWSREEEARMFLRTAQGEHYATWLYARLLQWVQRRYNPLEEKPPQHQAYAIVRALIRLFESQKLFFFGFHMFDELTTYQSYHVTNSAVLALMFGQTLGFSREQRLDLGWAALEHDIGKVQIPSHLLHKGEPLTAAEIEEMEQLPFDTVKQLVGAEFSWERVKQALIAMDVRLRPVAFAETPKADSLPSLFSQEEPAMVMSRIIRLCSCFDALCSERPFRPAMKPLDALALMRGPLAPQFDDVLLRRFVAFVWPVIRASTDSARPEGDAGEHSQEQDLLAMSHHLTEPALQELQRELQEYQLLKQVSNPTLEERHRLRWLQRYLTLRLRALMNETEMDREQSP